MKIRDFIIDDGSPCFIIAEIANNHDQNREQAIKLIESAARAGAQAVKFQTFTGLDIVSAEQLSSDYDWPPARQYKFWYQYLDTIMLPFEWYPELIGRTHDLGMAFISTPCSSERAEFLKKAGADALKIASMDNNNIPFLEDVYGLDMTVIISGGMASDDDLDQALSALGYPGNRDLALLHCVSKYPAAAGDMRLGRFAELKKKYSLPIGFSDHSLTNYSAFAAVALGAGIVEKHITLDRSCSGPDHFFSLEPDRFKDLVGGIREVEQALAGDSLPADKEAGKKMYRSIHAAEDLAVGTRLCRCHLEIKRPAGGLEPKYYRDIINRKIKRPLKACEPITWEDLE